MLFPQVVDISDKGQLLIPVDFRRSLGIKPKGKVFVWPDEKEKKLTIRPLRKENIVEATYGMLASNDGKSWTQELVEERRRDLIREETKFDSLFKNVRKTPAKRRQKK